MLTAASCTAELPRASLLPVLILVGFRKLFPTQFLRPGARHTVLAKFDRVFDMGFEVGWRVRDFFGTRGSFYLGVVRQISKGGIRAQRESGRSEGMCLLLVNH